MNALKMTFCVLVLSLLLAACGQRDISTSIPVNADMSIQVEPEPLAVGMATLIITLIDASDSPIDGATLRVHGDMDHEGMTPVDREVNDSTNGEYRVPFEWTMGGGWIVTITAQLPDDGGEITEIFDFFVEAVSSESIINRHSSSGSETTLESTEEATSSHREMDMNSATNPEDLPINITYEPDNDPVIDGDAIVTITLTDESGEPITDASVEIMGDMTHEGMMPIAGTGEHIADGNYSVLLHWTMAGDWLMTVTVTLADGGTIETTFDQQVIIQGD